MIRRLGSVPEDGAVAGLGRILVIWQDTRRQG